jgi:hypothetical protein
LIGKLFKKSNRELKKIKHEKESLFLQLSKSHVLIDSLKSENTMLIDTVDALENKLKESKDLMKKFSSDNLKSMLCIHSNISNKPALIVDMSTSTSHASDSELDSIDIKPMIVDTTCLENSYLNNHVMPKSKESGIQGKFIPKCHNCGKIAHIRPNFYLLKSHKPWIKQDALRKSEVENSSSSKYVPSHRRHIKGVSILASFCVWTKSLMCKDVVNRDSTCQSFFRGLCIEDRSFQIPCQLSRRSVIPSGRPPVHCSIRLDDVSSRPDARQTSIIRPDPTLCRGVSVPAVSVRTSQQPVWTPLGTRLVSDSF